MKHVWWQCENVNPHLSEENQAERDARIEAHRKRIQKELRKLRSAGAPHKSSKVL
jgi:hypothetical protein